MHAIHHFSVWLRTGAVLNISILIGLKAILEEILVFYYKFGLWRRKNCNFHDFLRTIQITKIVTIKLILKGVKKDRKILRFIT